MELYQEIQPYVDEFHIEPSSAPEGQTEEPV